MLRHPQSPPTWLAGVLAAAALLGLAPAACAAPDTTAPTVDVTAPVERIHGRREVTLTAAASDNVGVAEVRWYIDGVEVARDVAAEWSRTWNARSKASGTHEIYARARDAAGNWGTSATKSFTVRSIKGWPLVIVRLLQRHRSRYDEVAHLRPVDPGP